MRKTINIGDLVTYQAAGFKTERLLDCNIWVRKEGLVIHLTPDTDEVLVLSMGEFSVIHRSSIYCEQTYLLYDDKEGPRDATSKS